MGWSAKKVYRLNLQKFYDSFREELSLESDIFCPEWVLKFRIEQLNRLSRGLRDVCDALKSAGIVFRIKWPMEIEGKWHFADIYIPATDTVVIVRSRSASIQPGLFDTDRADIFRATHETVTLGHDAVERDADSIIALIDAACQAVG